MKTIIGIILVFLFIISCNQSISEPPQSESTLNKKPIKPPPTAEPLIGLSIDGTALITDNILVVYNVDPIFTLSVTEHPEISFTVVSPDDPIVDVEIHISYDSNVDNLISHNSEFGGRILYTKYPDNTDEISEIFEWDGIVEPIDDNDPIYKGNFQITDQLATLTSPDGKADHYKLQIYVLTLNQWKVLKSFIWLDNSIPPANTFHVNDINFEGVTQERRSYYPVYKVRILDKDDAPVKGADVHVVYNENYTINIGKALFLPTDENGWATIENSFTRKSFGELKMTVVGVQYYDSKNVGAPMSVYNP